MKNNMTSASLHSPKDYATHYSEELGFSVFVLQNPEKREEEGEFLVEARKKPAVLWDLYQIMRPSQLQIERWFEKNANYNIAAVTGNVSKIIAIDVDGPTAEKRIEEKILDMSTNLRLTLENTMINRTGSGGKHIIFRMDDHIEISQKVLWSNGETHTHKFYYRVIVTIL
jgi:Bifunctional DNA primase/polymerase, N-terminal